jgi:putative hemolysin
VNSSQLHELPSGLHQHAAAGALVLDRTVLDRTREVRQQPDWIGCDLSSYRLRLAEKHSERMAACRLRFRVFNLELGEGLDESYASGADQDEFDEVCEHLLVEEKSSGHIVGTYRMQSGTTARRHLGYYSAREFDFSPYERLRPEILELGRACIDAEHRNSEVLTLLWRGIAQYAQHHGFRYLIGCSSVAWQNAATAWALYAQLLTFLAEPSLRTIPLAAYALPQPSGDCTTPETKVPKLLKTYLAVGSRICSEPAWDRAFGTIDFLTLQDMDQLSPAARNRFLCRQ